MPVPPPRRVSAGTTARASVEVWALTVLTHTLAGGGLPSLPWLIGVAGLVAVSTAWVLRRAVRPAVMLPVLVLCQLALHVVLAGLAPTGHTHHAAAMSPWWLAELSPRMAAAHLLCALLTAAVWWLRRWVVDVVLTLARPLVVMRASGRAVSAAVSRGAAHVWLLSDPGRAPPRLATVA